MQLQASLFSAPDHECRRAAKMRGSKEVIKVAVGRAEDPLPKYRERDAVVYGPLALMPTVKWDGWEGRHEGWTITQITPATP